MPWTWITLAAAGLTLLAGVALALHIARRRRKANRHQPAPDLPRKPASGASRSTGQAPPPDANPPTICRTAAARVRAMLDLWVRLYRPGRKKLTQADIREFMEWLKSQQ